MQSQAAVIVRRVNALSLVHLFVVLGVALALAAIATLTGLARPGVHEENQLVASILDGPGALTFGALKVGQWLLFGGAALLLQRLGSPTLARAGLLGVIAYTGYLVVNNLAVIGSAATR